MRTISSSIALSTRGRPGLRCFEPSNLRATSLRYHPRMVSGWPTLQLASQDLVLSGEIFIPQQQLLVQRPADVGQDACPLHELPHLPVGSQWAPLIAPKNVTDNARRARAERHNCPTLLAVRIFWPYEHYWRRKAAKENGDA